MVRVTDAAGRTTDVALESFANGGTTRYLMISEPGEFVGRGLTWDYSPTSDLEIGATLDRKRIAIGIIGAFTGDMWRVELAPPPGGALAVGHYPDARYYRDAGQHAGLGVSGEARGCSDVTGDFTIHQLEFVGREITRARVSFVMHCQGATPALRGNVLVARRRHDPARAVDDPDHAGRPDPDPHGHAEAPGTPTATPTPTPTATPTPTRPDANSDAKRDADANRDADSHANANADAAAAADNPRRRWRQRRPRRCRPPHRRPRRPATATPTPVPASPLDVPSPFAGPVAPDAPSRAKAATARCTDAASALSRAPAARRRALARRFVTRARTCRIAVTKLPASPERTAALAALRDRAAAARILLKRTPSARDVRPAKAVLRARS